MLFHEFLHLTHNYKELITFLAQNRVIRNQIKYLRCNKIQHLNIEQPPLVIHCTEKYYEQVCHKKRIRKTCNFKISALSNTWFVQATLDLPTACRIICYFLLLNSPRQLFLKAELSISSRTAVDWINFCRELLAQWLSHNEEQIGGLNVVVEIDEAKFGKRKYHRGRLITGQWLFRGIERRTDKFFVLPVKERSSKILIPIILCHVAPGTIIYSNCWRAYNKLKNYNYTHQVVNHSENFVDPHTGIHTQNIERIWSDIRSGIPKYETRDYHYIHYLAEFIFKRKYQYCERIRKFFEIIATLYPLDENSTFATVE